jgi:hypothetical protein
MCKTIKKKLLNFIEEMDLIIGLKLLRRTIILIKQTLMKHHHHQLLFRNLSLCLQQNSMSIFEWALENKPFFNKVNKFTFVMEIFLTDKC